MNVNTFISLVGLNLKWQYDSLSATMRVMGRFANLHSANAAFTFSKAPLRARPAGSN